MARLKDKVAIITGAGQGIGAEAARRFVEEGAEVALLDIDVAAAETAAAKATQGGGRARAYACDITEPDAVAQAVADVLRDFGRVDVLYNNAGGSSAGDTTVVDMDLEAFWRPIKIDLFGTVLMCRNVLPGMIDRGNGVIINTSSMVALYGRPRAQAYTAAKGGVSALTRALAAQYGPQGIRVNALAPGITLSDRVRARLDAGSISQSDLDRHVMGLPEPIDIAQTAVFLASDEARRIAGQILPVDSGITAL